MSCRGSMAAGATKWPRAPTDEPLHLTDRLVSCWALRLQGHLSTVGLHSVYREERSPANGECPLLDADVGDTPTRVDLSSTPTGAP